MDGGFMNNRFSLTAAAVLMAAVANAWAQAPSFAISGYDVEGNTLLAPEKVEGILARYVGEGRTLDDINAAADALRRAYEALGFPVVKVFPPAQEAATGRIKLKVIEGQIKAVHIKGNQAYDAANIRNSLPPLQENVKPNAPEIVASIAAANENPAKQLAVNFQAAEELGHIDAVVNVTEDRPEKFTAGYDNMGAKSTGINRINVGYQNANLFNLDHMVTVQLGTSVDYPEKSQSFTGGYRIPFYSLGLSLDTIVAVSHSAATTQVGFGSTQFTGEGIMAGLRLNQSLPSAGEYRHRLIYGLDYKDFDNTCKVQSAEKNKCGTITAQPVSLAYLGTYNTPVIQATGNISYASNLEGGTHGSDADYTAPTSPRVGAKTDWRVWRLNSSVALPLPEDLQARATLNAQFSNDRLIPGEQFGLGGANSVRGYSERTVSGDSGYSLNFELYSPDLGKYIAPGISARALVFYDIGRVSFTHYQPIDASKSEPNLSSIGAGLRMNVGRDLAVKFDVGFAQEKFLSTQGTGMTRQQGDANAHASINLQF